MSTANSKKSTTAAVAGVGIVAGLAALQNADATGAPSAPADVAPEASASVAPVAAQAAAEAVAETSAPEAQQIDQLVQAYLGDGGSEALSAEALVADAPDAMLEPELLQALSSGPSVDVAALGDGGIMEMLSGLGGGSAALGGAYVAGGVLLGAYAADQAFGC